MTSTEFSVDGQTGTFSALEVIIINIILFIITALYYRLTRNDACKTRVDCMLPESNEILLLPKFKLHCYRKRYSGSFIEALTYSAYPSYLWLVNAYN